MDLNKLMDMAQEVRKRMEEVQTNVEKVEVEGEAGGGMVKVRMNGVYRLTKLKIEPSLLAQGDCQFLEDLVAAGVNQAAEKVGAALKAQAGDVASQFGVDLSQFGK